jgi:hypothetical protein
VTERPGARALAIASALLVVAYVTYAAVFLHVPFVSSDEVWMITRGEYLMRHGVVGEPTLDPALSPFLGNLFRAGILGHLSGYLYYGTLGLGAAIAPSDPVGGHRALMIVWSLVVLALTYAIARRLELRRAAAIASVGWLAIVPEFVGQAHHERFEMVLAAGVLAGVLLLLWAIELPSGWKRRAALAMVALYAWVPAIFIHYSGICLPPVLAVVYLVRARPRFAWTELLGFGALMLPGALLFVDLVLAPSRAAGGVYGVSMQGPPILSRDLWYFLKTPLHLYERLHATNDTSRAVSSLWLAAAMAAAVLLWRSRADRRAAVTAIAAAVTTIATLVLVSGSYGPYVILATPFAAILLGAASLRLVERASSRVAVAVIAVMAVIFGTNLLGLDFHTEQRDERARVEREVASLVPVGSRVVAQPHYYLALRERGFASILWVNGFYGRPEMSFAEGVRASRAEYVVVDDYTICTALKGGRDSVWLREMGEFLSGCEEVGEIRAHLFNAVTRVAPDLPYPPEWRPVDPGFIQRIRIYRVAPDQFSGTLAPSGGAL